MEINMPNKKEREHILDITWFYAKIVFALTIFGLSLFAVGTYYPNQKAVVKISNKIDEVYVNKIKEMDLQEPDFIYANDIEFVKVMHKCINYINFTTPKNLRVPYEMIIGQAALESGWGTSRFSTEGNNLFGIRTWSKDSPHLLLIGVKKWPGWGVKVFTSKCNSVKYYIDLLNNHNAYKEFRELRKKTKDPIELIKTLDKFSTTKDYDIRVIRVIGEIRTLEKKNEL